MFARGNDHRDAVGAAPTVIGAGDSVDGEIRSSADRAVFEVSAADQPILVEVQPSGFDASLDVAAIGSGDESIPETVDEYRTDASEFAVIAPGTGIQRVTVGGRGSGEFRLLARLVNPRPVDVPGRLAGMKFATSGEPLVLQVRSADDTAFVVTTSSTSPSTASTLTINGPAKSTSLSSVSAEPSLATITAGGAPGVFTVVCGGSAADSNGTVDVTVRRADVLPAPIGEVTEFRVRRHRTRARPGGSTRRRSPVVSQPAGRPVVRDRSGPHARRRSGSVGRLVRRRASQRCRPLSRAPHQRLGRCRELVGQRLRRTPGGTRRRGAR